MTAILREQYSDVVRARDLVKASLEEYRPFDPDYDYTPKQLEFYDALSSRFSRLVDLITAGMFRSIELHLFNEKSPTLRDSFLRMEKIRLIIDTEKWWNIRLLRNKITHTYIPEDLAKIYHEINQYAEDIFSTVDGITGLLIKEKIIEA